LPEGVVTRLRGNGVAISEADLVEAFRRSLAQPLDYPSLAEVTVPGDRVAITLADDLPQPIRMLEGALASLRDAGVETANVALVLPTACRYRSEVEQLLQRLHCGEVTVEIHDPADPLAAAMVGVTKADRPLRINRTASEADVLLAIGVATVAGDVCNPTFAGLFPQYSDEATIARHAEPIRPGEQELVAERQDEIAEALWMLGVGITVEVCPAPGGQIAQIFAGELNSVARTATEAHRKCWSCDAEQLADLVVGTINGEPTQQTWRQVGRALAVAELLVKPGGPIVLCTDLAEPPGRSLNRLAAAKNQGNIERHLLRDHEADTQAALHLYRALDQGPVFLRSQLAAHTVERLGLVPISSDDQLQRLVGQFSQCLVAEDAHLLQPAVSAPLR
jgi:nickel-dependent lactate racemase